MTGVLMRIVLDLLITFGRKVIFFTILILPTNKQESLCHLLESSLVSFFGILVVPLERISTSFVRFIDLFQE